MYDAHLSIPGGGSPFAGFWRRVTASSIDSSLLGFPIYIVMGLQGASLFAHLNENFDSYLAAREAFFAALSAEVVQISTIFAALFFVYKTGFEASGMRATIGKLVVGLRVTDKLGNRLSIPAAALRSWPAWAPAALLVLDARVGTNGMLLNAAGPASLLACITVAITPRKRGLHDIMAGALVVRAAARFGTAQAT
ncbi:MAG: RDD family protein [Alphaproteobacteria bacterium]|nr:RDD family protein [Alphaproteobacteria bacterium]